MLTPFKADAPTAVCSPAEIKSCALDLVNGNAATDVNSVKAAADVTLVGWAADAETATVPGVAVVELVHKGAKSEKKYFAAVQRITKRPDVADAFKLPAMADAGYDLLTSVKDVPPGEYAVEIVQVNSAGNALICDTRRTLKVE